MVGKSLEVGGYAQAEGISFSAADCLIATTALEHGAVLWHCDQDFEHIKRHSPLKTFSLIKYIDP